MQRIAWIILAGCLATSPLAHADEWAKSYTIQVKPDLYVDTSDANIHVDTWDKNTIEAHITSDRYKINSRELQLQEHQNGDRVEISLRFPARMSVFSFNTHGPHVDIDIHMPREGRMELQTGDGKIQVSNFKGIMELQSGDGNQELDAVDGTLRARAGDGQIHVSGRFDGLDLSTGDGRIDARIQPGSTMSSAWILRTGDGGVTLQLPDQFSADLDMHTGDGHINVDMPLSIEGRVNGRNIHGKLNGGGNTLTVHTGDGSINLEKS